MSRKAGSEPYVLSAEELRGLQMAELDMLREVDRICRANNIPYRIAAGTLLGAVRHGGFIPWDDDADIHFTRDEYERFRTACASQLDHARFYFQDLETTPGYRWGYGKLRMKDTLFLRDGQAHMPYEQGIFIDLFVDDYVPNNYIARCLCALTCFFYRKAFWSEVGKHTARGAERLVYRMVSQIPEAALKASYARFVKKRRAKTDWMRTLTFPAPTRDYGYPGTYWDTFGEIAFEGHTFMTFGRADEYLSFKYGDYMTLPPESKRKVHPVSQLKLPQRRADT